MKRTKYTQCAVCAGKDYDESARIFNEKMQELMEMKPRFERDGNVFLIFYTVEEIVPEGLAEEMELQGIKHVCAECEHFKVPLNRHGQPDGRKKKILCERAHQLATPGDRVCDIFYEEHQDVKDFAPSEVSKIIALNGKRTNIEVGA